MEETFPAPNTRVIFGLLFLNLFANPLYSLICSKFKFFPNLTSPSRNNTSRLGKNLWVKNQLNPKPKVIFAYSADKQRYSKENAILIDDKKSNINEWAAKGGIAIRCKNGDVDHVIEKLKELGYE